MMEYYLAIKKGNLAICDNMTGPEGITPSEIDQQRKINTV